MYIEKYILDPLSVIVKLAILSKKPIGTKIAIWSNTIYIQEIGMFQSLVRILYSTSKNDIQYLYNPIEIACSNYLTPYYITNFPDIKNLFSNAIKGLEKLKETYSHNIMISHSINLYTSLINNYLGENFNSKLFTPDVITNEYKKDELEKIFVNTWIPTNTLTLYTNLDSKQIKDKNKESIKEGRIKGLLDFIDFIDKDKESNSVKCLEEFMIIIDNETKSKIDAINIEEEAKNDVLIGKNLSSQPGTIQSQLNTLQSNTSSQSNKSNSNNKTNIK